MMKLKNKKGIIIACDLLTIEALKLLIKETYNVKEVVGYKIGFALCLKYGLQKITQLIKSITDLPIIYDHQKAGTDIPAIGQLFAKICADSNLDAVILFPQAGPETEKAFITALFDFGIEPIVGGEMTHNAYLEKDGGFLINDAPKKIYKIASQLNVKNFVIPGNKYESIKYHVENISKEIKNPKFFMPGIGTQGGNLLKAFDAVGNYNAYAIVGSVIYQSEDPAGAIKKILEI